MKVGVRSLLFSRRTLTNIVPSLIANVLPEKNCQNFERKKRFWRFSVIRSEGKKKKSEVTRFVYFGSHFVAKNIKGSLKKIYFNQIWLSLSS